MKYILRHSTLTPDRVYVSGITPTWFNGISKPIFLHTALGQKTHAEFEETFEAPNDQTAIATAKERSQIECPCPKDVPSGTIRIGHELKLVRPRKLWFGKVLLTKIQRNNGFKSEWLQIGWPPNAEVRFTESREEPKLSIAENMLGFSVAVLTGVLAVCLALFPIAFSLTIYLKEGLVNAVLGGLGVLVFYGVLYVLGKCSPANM